MGRYLERIRDELGPGLREKPFLVMQSSGGVASPDQVMCKPITTALSGPAAGALGSAVIAEMAGFPNVVTLDAGGTSTDLCLIESARPNVTNGGAVGPFPVRIPMIDIETIGTGGGSIAWISREGHLKVGPRSAGAEPGPMCYPNGGNEPTITDANLVLGRIPPALIGGGIRLNAERARAGIAALAARLPGNMSTEQLAEGIIEIANWNQSNAIRQMTIQRGIDPRKFALLSFGGSGPAQSPAVMDLIGMKACIVPPNPGNLSAFGLLAVDWRTDHIVTKVMHEDAIDLAAVADIYAGLEADAAATLERDGIEPSRIRRVREADVRYAGQSMEVRVPAPSGAVGPAFINGLDRCVPRRPSQDLRLQLRRSAEGGAGQFRVSGFGMIDRPSIPKLDIGPAAAPKSGQPAGVFRRRLPGDAGLPARLARRWLPPRRTGRGRGVRLHHRGVSRPAARGRRAWHFDRAARAPRAGGGAMNVQPAGQPWPTAPSLPARAVDPIVLQIVEGTLNSIEAEIEYAIERTARSPMIREAHDYRVGLFDRYCRKLTGRSYSAMPNAVVRDFPPETMQPGDVFLMNDTYLTEGSIGHLPDLCSTVPVFHRRRGGRLYPGLRPSRRHRRAGAGLDAGHGRDRVRGRPRRPADQALQRGRAQRRGLHHHQAQHSRARHARGRSRQRGAGLRDGRAAHGGAVRAVRARNRGSLLPGHPRQVPRHLSARAAAEDRRRRISLGGLCRARRRNRSQAAQARDHDDQEGGPHHPRLHRHRSAVHRPDQLAGRLCRRRVPDQMDRADPAQPRRHARARGGNPRQ